MDPLPFVDAVFHSTTTQAASRTFLCVSGVSELFKSGANRKQGARCSMKLT